MEKNVLGKINSCANSWSMLCSEHFKKFMVSKESGLCSRWKIAGNEDKMIKQIGIMLCVVGIIF